MGYDSSGLMTVTGAVSDMSNATETVIDGVGFAYPVVVDSIVMTATTAQVGGTWEVNVGVATDTDAYATLADNAAVLADNTCASDVTFVEVTRSGASHGNAKVVIAAGTHILVQYEELTAVTSGAATVTVTFRRIND